MIVTVGGKLDKSKKSIILGKLKEKLPDETTIAIIPTASKNPELIGAEYESAFRLFGFENISVLTITKREDAYMESYLKTAEEADMIVLTGGDQLKLTSLLGGTPIPEIIKRKAGKGVILGDSAGATVLSNPMIYDGKGKRGFLKGEVELTSGFGLLENIAIDSHFVERGRLPRLIYVVVSNPKVLGVGLGENTAISVENDIAEVWGTYSVIIVDGLCIKRTNIATVKKRKPISATHICIHVLGQGSVIDLKEREILKIG
ncbi:MAG: cyanophycinase [Theionarchaea archaeon]|nr:cyanophycinase [Theionarchaea archaeon]